MGLVLNDVAAATEFYTRKLEFEVDEQAGVPQAYTQFELNDGPILGLMAGLEPAGVEQA